MPAQRLAQTRPGARGAVLVSACVPPGTYADTWPAGVPLQVHGMEQDPVFVRGGDLDAAETWSTAPARTPNSSFIRGTPPFADISLPDYDETAAPALTGAGAGVAVDCE